MRLPRLMATGFSPAASELSQNVTHGLTVAQTHYIVRVLRLKPGAQLVLTDGNGQEYLAELLHAGRGDAQIRILSTRSASAESPLSIELALAVSRGERMDFAMQKSVELGVTSISPLLTERTVVQLDAKRTGARMQHWQQIITSACEQSGRNHLPRLNPPEPLSRWVTNRARVPALIFHPQAEQPLAGLPVPQQGALQLLVGPEGGFSHQELALAQAAGITAVTMGPRILRTETAAICAICAAQTLWGDMGRCVENATQR